VSHLIVMPRLTWRRDCGIVSHHSNFENTCEKHFVTVKFARKLWQYLRKIWLCNTNANFVIVNQ